LRDGYENIKNAGAAELIAISSDTQIGAGNSRDKINNAYPVLSDEDLVTINAYNVLQAPANIFARPATFIINEDGKIAWSDVGERFGHRTRSTQIIEGLNSIE
jgi:peroxiredoxin